MNDKAAKANFSEADKLAIVEQYTAASPTLANSREIARAIAEQRGVRVEAIRHVLWWAGVYISQPKPRTVIRDQADKAALIKAYNQASAANRKSIRWRDELARNLNY